MHDLTVHSHRGAYTVRFFNDFSFAKELAAVPQRVFFIDANVMRLHRRALEAVTGRDRVIPFTPSEKKKSLATAQALYKILLRYPAKRNITLITIGGGVTQDVAGFTASTLYRGIRWIYIPTTLLAQADSCIGAKTGLNFMDYKNLIGTFYAPEKVLVSSAFLTTLPREDVVSGLGEIAKLLITGARGSRGLKSVEEAVTRILTGSPRDLLPLIRESLSIKKPFVEADEFDEGKRRLLNYGHEFGHALESVSRFRVSHGLAVVVGMIFADIIARDRNILREELSQHAYEHIYRPLLEAGNAIYIARYLNHQKLLAAVKMDKKRVRKELPLVLRTSANRLMLTADLTDIEFVRGIYELKKLLGIKTSRAPVRAVLFDYDGVLADSMEDNYRAWRAVFRRHHGIALDRDAYMQLEGRRMSEVVTILAREYRVPLTQKLIAQMIQEKEALYLRRYRGMRFYPGTRALIRELGKRRVRLAIISGASRNRLLQSLSPAFLRQFHTVITADDVRHTKPHAEPYTRALHKLGLPPHEALVVENSPLGVASARGAGIPCIAISTTLGKQFLRHADVVARDFTDLRKHILARISS